MECTLSEQKDLGNQNSPGDKSLTLNGGGIDAGNSPSDDLNTSNSQDCPRKREPGVAPIKAE